MSTTPAPTLSPFEATIVKSLERLIKIVDERVPIPVQISPRGLIHEALLNRGWQGTVVAAVATMCAGNRPPGPIKPTVLGVAHVPGRPMEYVGVVIIDADGDSRYAELKWDDSAVDAARNISSSCSPSRQRMLESALLDMLAHGESERILP